jgi:hypothetical protein
MEPEAGKINQRSGAGGGKILGKAGNPAPKTLIIFRAMEIGVKVPQRVTVLRPDYEHHSPAARAPRIA